MPTPEILLIYLLFSTLFIWVVIRITTSKKDGEKPQITEPDAQLRYAIAIFAGILILSSTKATVLQRFFHGGSPAAGIYAISGIIFAAVAASVLTFNDRPSSVGITVKNSWCLAIFLFPFFAIVILPGGMENIRTILYSISGPFVAAAFSEELFFRGYLQTRFKAVWGAGKGILAASAAYAVFNLLLVFGLNDFYSISLGFLMSFFVLGIIGGSIFNRTGNIFGSVIYHIFVLAIYSYGSLVLNQF